MGPITRNSKVCLDCKESMLGAGVQDVRCQLCWQLKTDSLEDRVRELENRGVEEASSSSRECNDCVQLKEKLENLENSVGLRHVGAENEVKKLVEKIERYEREIEEGVKNVCDLNDIKIRNIRLQTTVDDYGAQLFMKSELIGKLEESWEKAKQENEAFQLQCQEYQKEIGSLKSLCEKARVEGEAIGRDKENWKKVGLGVRNRVGDANNVNNSTLNSSSSSSSNSFVSAGDVSQEGVVASTPRNTTRSRASDRSLGNPPQNSRNLLLPTSQGKSTGRDSIVVIGSSMVRNINKVVGMKESGSFLRSIGGAGIKQIMGEAVLAANQASDGTKLFIQVGGNSLKHIRVQNIVRSIVDGVQDIYSANNRIAVSVLGLIPHPRENGLYGRAR